jgi:hypothetical protein
MRMFWLWLMICLLPLRALAGDAMAIQMQQGSPSAISQAQAWPAPEVPGCHSQLDAVQPQDEARVHPGTIHHGNDHHETAGHTTLCLVCDICHSAAALSPVTQLVAAAPSAHVPAHVRGPITSAEHLPVHKPPIA